MKLIIEKLPDLSALYIRQLRIMLSTEEQNVRGLPIMIETATDAQLKQAFQSHLEETEDQVERLQHILEDIAGEAKPIYSKVLASLVDETEDQVQSCSHDAVRDAALIVGARRIEHYEIASYGALRQIAHGLGRDADATLLNQNMHEEGHVDHLLTSIAEQVNPTAQRVTAA